MFRSLASNPFLFVALMAFAGPSLAAPAASASAPAMGELTVKKPAPRKIRGPLPVPFGLELGKSKLEDAEAAWKGANAREIRRSQAATAGDKVMLVDIEGVDFFGTPRVGRFAFYDGTLYSVMGTLRSLSRENRSYVGMSEDALLALETDLRKRFGAPSETGSDLDAATPRPNNLTWTTGRTKLVLHYGLNASTLNLASESLSRKVAEYRVKLACKKKSICTKPVLR